jgi:hypothetical protein
MNRFQEDGVGIPLFKIKNDIENLKINALLTDLKLTANSSNIDAWCDLLNDFGTISSSNNIHWTGNSIVSNFNISINPTDYSVVEFAAVTDPRGIGQGFTATSIAPISNVVVPLAKVNTPTNTIQLQIWNCDQVTGEPLTAKGVNSNIINASTLTTQFQPITFTFTTTDNDNVFVIGEKYFVAIISSAYSTANTLRTSFGGETYSGGRVWRQNTAGWMTYIDNCDLNMIINNGITNSADATFLVTSDSVLEKIAVCTQSLLPTGAITFQVSQDGVTWVNITNLKEMYLTNFTTTTVYLKCTLTLGAELQAVAWGG